MKIVLYWFYFFYIGSYFGKFVGYFFNINKEFFVVFGC